MQNATGGVKQKIYGKKGRRIRAKERLEKRLSNYQKVVDNIKNKKEKQSFIENESITVSRLTKEIETLNSRI